jgi:pseudaminic acid biosynthesis-associated methylase|tara:strand:+ start:936 stop:1571 length:636 start_codon:yes stop_codon:yes gene_type:complete
MSGESEFKTDQETFWAGDFCTDYIARNRGKLLLASNLNFFSKALKRAGKIRSCHEFGANIGMNLRALKLLYPEAAYSGVEINADACKELTKIIGQENVFNGSIFNFPVVTKFDLSLIKGVLIHINPDMLNKVYEKLYEASNKYILVCEYYNPSPVKVSYRGHKDRLFKRDFAGELMERYSDLILVDYGFVYRKDPVFPQDDVTWFLMKKGI